MNDELGMTNSEASAKNAKVREKADFRANGNRGFPAMLRVDRSCNNRLWVDTTCERGFVSREPLGYWLRRKSGRVLPASVLEVSTLAERIDLRASRGECLDGEGESPSPAGESPALPGGLREARDGRAAR